MTRPLRTVLVGAGQAGAGLASDARMARWFPRATHAQVLAAHPGFDWVATVDRQEPRLAAVRARWPKPLATTRPAEAARLDPEVAVLATPPGERLAVLDALPSLRAVLVEKPLGATLAEAETFFEACSRRGILVQVNYWRRGDPTLRALAEGGAARRLGPLQAGNGLYGNGVRNNGSHLVDLIRMLAGEVATVQALHAPAPFPGGPLAGDRNVPFHLGLRSGAGVAVQPVRFEAYREIALDLWGRDGRLELLQETLLLRFSARRPNRGLEGADEVASDAPEILPCTVGDAMDGLYANLAEAVHGKTELWSAGESALATERVLAAIDRSAAERGRAVSP